MKRRIFLIIIVLVFNYFLFVGINYTNKYLSNHKIVIYLQEHEVEVPEDPVKPIVIDEFAGEKKEVIVSKINKYLTKTELNDIGSAVFNGSVIKDVDPYLIAAIILVNTKCDQECSVIMKSCNNISYFKGSPGCFGGNYKKYNSLDDSIIDLADYISVNYIKNDLKTPYDFYKKLGKNLSWAYKVDKVMKEMKKVKV